MASQQLTPGLLNPRTLLFALVAVLLAFGAVIINAAPSQAACSGVSGTRVRYWCDTVRPLNAYGDKSSAKKHYNEMYEGGSLPVGIYFQDPSTGAKFH